MFFPLQKLPRELITQIASCLELEDILNLRECLDFDISAQTYHRFFPYDGRFAKYDVRFLEERIGAKPYLFTTKLQPVHLAEPIVKVTVDSHWVYFLTRSGDIWFTGKDIEEEYAMVQNSADKDWGISDGLVRFKSEEVYLQDPELFGEYSKEWARQHPSYLRSERRKYVDVAADNEWMSMLNLVDDQGVVISIEDDSYRELEDGWFDCDYGSCMCDPKMGEGHSQTNPLILDRALKVQSRSTMFEGRGVALSYGIFFDAEDCRVQENLIVPNTATGVKDWARFRECVICLRTNGTVELVQIPEGEHIDRDYETPPEYICSLEVLNKMASFVQLSAYGDKLALVTTTGRVVIATVNVRIAEAHFVEGLANVSCVAVGGDSFLALTKSGEVYSCGVTHQRTRNLGLEELPVGVSSVKEKPYKVGLPGKAYYIAAGSSCSIILCS